MNTLRPLILLAAASVALSACGAGKLLPHRNHEPKAQPEAKAEAKAEAPKPAPPALAPPPVDTSGAKPTAGLDWEYVEESGMARLAYGGSAGATTKLMFTCNHNSGVASAQRPVATATPGTPPKLSLVSGSAHSTGLALLEQTNDPAISLLTVKVGTLEAVLQAFLKTGNIGVQEGDKVEPYVAQPGNSAIRRWFFYCGS